MGKLLRGLGVAAVCATATFAQAEERTMLVLDASGSMWGQLEGKAKIEIARDALKKLLADWPTGREVGLVVYGHRSKGDCKDIETLIPVGPLDAATMSAVVDKLNPKGKTPLSAAVKQAAEALKYTEDKATVVLLSDGKETCGMDPCALGAELEKLGVDFTAHVIGFDVSKSEDQAGLRCLSENTGGQFIPASNASELTAALEQTVKAPEPEPTPEPEPIPEPEPTPPVPAAELQVPESAIKGTLLEVGLKAEEGLKGYVYLYPKGRDKHVSYGTVALERAGGYRPSSIRLPATPGEYTLKWVVDRDVVVAEAPLSVTDAEIVLELPEQVVAGTEINVGLKAPDGLDGYVYQYPKGRDKHVSYGRVVEKKEGGYQPVGIRLVSTPGDYTLKWINGKDEVLAEAPLVVVAADISLAVPELTPRGTSVSVGLNGPDKLDGYVYLYAKGKDKSITYGTVREDAIKGYQPSELRLPATPGEYTLKWVSGKDEVLAEAPLVVADAEISLDAPEQVEKGTEINVGLSGPDKLDGYVYLYAKGKDKSVTYGTVREDAIQGYGPSRIQMPDVTGDFVLKWVSGLDEVLAERPIRVVEEIIEEDAPPAAEDKPAEPADGQTDGPAAAGASGSKGAAAMGLNPVPPKGMDSMDEGQLRYYQELGPLEFSARLLGLPAYPGWRLHFALHPVIDAQDQILSGYRVDASRINLSPAIYRQLVGEYGEENADPAFKDASPSDLNALPFAIVQNVTADFLADDATHSGLAPEGKPCGLLADCAAVWMDNEGADWGKGEALELELAPWQSAPEPVAGLVRALAKQAGWLQQNDAGQWQWVTPEMPEGLGPERPWVEITIDNHAGNGGGLLADWVEPGSDDSVSARLVRAVLFEGNTATVYQAQLCARGEKVNTPVQRCP